MIRYDTYAEAMPKTQQLSDETIVTILREEWARRKTKLHEETRFLTTSPGLKIKSKHTGILFTVVSVAPGMVTVKNPTGDVATLSNDSIESDFELA